VDPREVPILEAPVATFPHILEISDATIIYSPFFIFESYLYKNKCI
jgi:hypothetical protein